MGASAAATTLALGSGVMPISRPDSRVPHHAMRHEPMTDRAGPDRGNAWGAEVALDWMFWPTKNVGWYVQPTWSVNPKNGQESIAVSIGLLTNWISEMSRTITQLWPLLLADAPGAAVAVHTRLPVWVILDAPGLSAARRLTVRSLSIGCN
jgi:hypothetical protein